MWSVESTVTNAVLFFRQLRRASGQNFFSVSENLSPTLQVGMYDPSTSNLAADDVKTGVSCNQ